MTRRLLSIGVALTASSAGILLAGCDGASNAPDTTLGKTSSMRTTPEVDANSDLVVAADAAGPRWASVASATIAPGIQTFTEGAGQCTANFVYVDSDRTVYIGQAAHCATTGESSETNGCTAGSLPLGTAVTFRRSGSQTSEGTVIGSGELVYSSWLTMQKRGETDPNACAYNDLALIKVAAADIEKVNPSIPHWGGPDGINTAGLLGGVNVYGFGNSSIRAGVEELSPQIGRSEADNSTYAGWTHRYVSPTPGIPGDSGSAFLDANGRALGTLSTLGIGLPIINNIGDIRRELEYARDYSGVDDLRLVLGTERFSG